jgi:hypothetical protein
VGSLFTKTLRKVLTPQQVSRLARTAHRQKN